jgi:hypothetical protein
MVLLVKLGQYVTQVRMCGPAARDVQHTRSATDGDSALWLEKRTARPGEAESRELRQLPADALEDVVRPHQKTAVAAELLTFLDWTFALAALHEPAS